MIVLYGLDGKKLTMQEAWTLKGALSFGAGVESQKPQSEVRLYKHPSGFSVNWHDGTSWTGKMFETSSTTTEPASSK